MHQPGFQVSQGQQTGHQTHMDNASGMEMGDAAGDVQGHTPPPAYSTRTMQYAYNTHTIHTPLQVTAVRR